MTCGNCHGSFPPIPVADRPSVPARAFNFDIDPDNLQETKQW